MGGKLIDKIEYVIYSSGDCKQKEVKTILLIINSKFNTEPCTPIARQRLDKHIHAEANGRNNRTSIAKQRISKHASLTIQTVFCVVRERWLYRRVQVKRVSCQKLREFS
jgi:hypothetical protein